MHALHYIALSCIIMPHQSVFCIFTGIVVDVVVGIEHVVFVVSFTIIFVPLLLPVEVLPSTW